MKIKKSSFKNFTVFKKQEIEFCGGVNVIIGANGTGKSHLLKLLYAATQWMTGEKNGYSDDKDKIRFLNLLNGLFKPENGGLDLLMRIKDSNRSADIEIEADNQKVESFRIYADKKYQNYDPSIIAQLANAKGIFIPPDEVLAIYPGFAASYEKRELAFDQTYYDVCKALAAAPLKGKNEMLAKLVGDLEELLQGRVVLKGDRFYVQNADGGRNLEAHLLAEGHRKVATIVQLIKNGSVSSDTVLFWDEPESNLNPRMTKHIASFLLELAESGIQIFIATHDYLLTGELSFAAEYKKKPDIPIRFFAMSREGDSPVKIQSGETLADLQGNPILEEFAAHYQREQDAIARIMKGEERNDDHQRS